MFVGRAGLRRGPGLIRTVGRTAVIAGTATAVSGAVSRGQERRAAEQDAYAEQQAYPPQGYAAQQAPGGITDEQLGRLERLAELHQAGVLSAAEFEAQKAQILGR
ncbi:MAG TPA: SHOCT domain-containing protein [Actinophytocola sp.]|uniref:SHOCT domain-containing protein n=1 Tax=Actinophytocola sp. TaxID=1872138 RepID=UPI002DBF226E|nr:SHOCT domain-containing protein [Actinophytocola sp.]HEU5473516.1 SHOCT domain-containing protein [Actinophytocola sp.]